MPEEKIRFELRKLIDYLAYEKARKHIDCDIMSLKPKLELFIRSIVLNSGIYKNEFYMVYGSGRIHLRTDGASIGVSHHFFGTEFIMLIESDDISEKIKYLMAALDSQILSYHYKQKELV